MRERACVQCVKTGQPRPSQVGKAVLYLLLPCRVGQAEHGQLRGRGGYHLESGTHPKVHMSRLSHDRCTV